MTGERGTPNRPSGEKQSDQRFRKRSPANPAVSPYRPSPQPNVPQTPTPRPMERPSLRTQVSGKPSFVSHQFVSDQELESPPDPMVQRPTSRDRRRRRQAAGLPKFRLSMGWQGWTILLMLLIAGTGGLAAALLFKLPTLPNCPSIFWPTASGSLRIYCAQLAANKHTVNDLLEAIALVNSLPADHPLRPEVDHYIEEWATDILNLAEQTFQTGALQEAIAIVHQIPTNTSAHKLVDERLNHWDQIWTKAEGIYQEAEAAIEEQHLTQAFAIAVRLSEVSNTYWSTTKYQELSDLIATARLEGGKLSRAMTMAGQGRLSSLLDAIQILEGIQPSSPAYKQAQRLLKQVGQTMMDLADTQLTQRDAQEAIAIVRQIPASAGLADAVEDFTHLATARQQAWEGTADKLEAAILQAQQIQRNRPLYQKAQGLIERWQLEIQDLSQLASARQLAEPGTVDALASAIAEARLIPDHNPRSAEAQREIDRWTAQIQTIEDSPTFHQAEQLASNGDLASLQAAIATAGRIQRGRALYDEAQHSVQTWTNQIQRIEDAPSLNRARQLAQAGNLPEAIATAQPIAPGRALYDEAQTNIRQWRNQIDADHAMRQAYVAASAGNADNLLAAIRAADRVPTTAALRSDADRMINVWSREILRIAEDEANYNLDQAITTASSIPPRTEAYANAQLQLQAWRQLQAPTQPVAPSNNSSP